MPVPLSKILARRPRGGSQGKEWIGVLGLPETTLSMGDHVGIWNPSIVPLTIPVDQGLALGMRECLVSRFDGIWSCGTAAVWQVLACQEDSPYVPGIGVFLDPMPPCMLCQPCAEGNHAHCVESGIRRWGPGWIAREMVVPPWTVNRGIQDLPANASVRAGLFLEPLGRIRHGLKALGKFRPHRVAVLGGDLLGFLTGLALEREFPDSMRCLVRGGTGSDLPREFGFQTRIDGSGSLESALAGAPQLVVVASSDPKFLAQALEVCATGGTVLQLAPPSGQVGSVDYSGLWRRGIRIVPGAGISPDDRAAANRWIEDLSKRLEALPVAELPFEQAARASDLLEADPNLVGVVLTT